MKRCRNSSWGPGTPPFVLPHDPKFEDPALTSLLRTETGYIGAIGSRGTHAKRVARLREAGFTDSEIARIHSPVGLNLGAATPEEIAIAILAEIVAVRRGRNAGSLSRGSRCTGRVRLEVLPGAAVDGPAARWVGAVLCRDVLDGGGRPALAKGAVLVAGDETALRDAHPEELAPALARRG